MCRGLVRRVTLSLYFLAWLSRLLRDASLSAAQVCNASIERE